MTEIPALPPGPDRETIKDMFVRLSKKFAVLREAAKNWSTNQPDYPDPIGIIDWNSEQGERMRRMNNAQKLDELKALFFRKFHEQAPMFVVIPNIKPAVNGYVVTCPDGGMRIAFDRKIALRYFHGHYYNEGEHL